MRNAASALVFLLLIAVLGTALGLIGAACETDESQTQEATDIAVEHVRVIRHRSGLCFGVVSARAVSKSGPSVALVHVPCPDAALLDHDDLPRAP